MTASRDSMIMACPVCGAVRYPRGEWIEPGNQSSSAAMLLKRADELKLLHAGLCDYCAARHIYMTEAAGD